MGKNWLLLSKLDNMHTKSVVFDRLKTQAVYTW